MDIVGLRHNHEMQIESKNLAYLFRFTHDENAINDNFEKADNDRFTFDIIHMEII